MADQNTHKSVRMSELRISGTPETIPPPSQPTATTQTRYVYTKFHARGGMGEIWICRDSQLGRDVAIKRLSSSGQLAKQRFLAEAHVTGQLEHPAIVPIHDMGEDEAGRPFYVMRFVRGRSLKEAIGDYYAKPPRGELSPQLQWRRLLDVFIDLCHAVAYAHSRGVLHRDLKPDNVMLGAYGETVLLDWGLAKIRGEPQPASGPSTGVHSTISGTGTNTEAGSVIGSPLYMPPEMAEGRITDTDERTDIYLLGATLYEILTGRPPREGKSFDDLLAMARTAAVVPPSRFRNVPRALNAICLKAMSQKQEDRYASAMDLAGDMERYLAGEPVSAYREGILIRAWRFAKRHQLALKRTAIAALILIAAAVTWTTFRQAQTLRAREEARSRVQSFEKLVDEARFFAASSDPTAEHAPYYDPAKARAVSQQALAAAAGWGPTLDQLPLPDQRAPLRAEMYELILLTVQNDLHSSRKSDPDVRLLLDRAHQLMPQPSRGYYALEAQSAQLANDPALAAQQEKLAADSATPSIAFDSFLSGEEFRTRSATETAASPQRIDDLNQAIHFYSQAIQQDPKHFWAHFQLGRCYMSVGELPEAVEALGTCIALRPDAPWGYSARGMALGLLHRYDEAQVDLNRALQLDPDFRPALLNRGVVYSLQKDQAKALADFTAALQPPDDRVLIEATYYRSQIYVENQDLDRAIADLNSLIAQRPDFYPGYLLRARVQMLRGAQGPGLEDLESLLRHDVGPSFDIQTSQGLEKRGAMLRRLAADLPDASAVPTLRLARQDLESALKLNDQSPDAYSELGAVQELLGETGAAAADYSSAIKLAPTDVGTLIDRGWLYKSLNRIDQAAADFSAAIAANPNSAEAHCGLGYVAACQRSYGQAQEEAAQALLLGSDDYLILHNIACIYAEMYRTDTSRQAQNQIVAIATLKKAISLWRSRGSGPDELHLISQEPAFSALRGTKEFKEMISEAQR